MAREQGGEGGGTSETGDTEEGSKLKRLRSKPVTQAADSAPIGAAEAGGVAPLTAASIAAMNEVTLRQRVIIKLLEAQHWQDVREGHGPTERGKDIVAWRIGDDGERVDLAVVAKATAIDGQAKITSRSAGGVATQVLQCFGAPATARATGAVRAITRCLVITNKEITQTGADAFWDMMRGTIRAEKVELIVGQRLWELVREHLTQAFIGRVADARAAAEAFADPQYRLDFTSDATGTTIDIRERYDGAFEERPLAIEIADGPGAAEALAAQLRVAAEDMAVIIEGDAARAVRLPEELRHLIPVDGLAQVTIDLPERIERYSAELRLDDGAGPPLLIKPLEVDLHQISGAQARFTNRHQVAPPLRCWYDTDLAAAPEGGVFYTTGKFHFGPGSNNVEDRRTVARLRAQLRRPCTMRLIDRTTRQMLVEARLPAEAPSPGLDAILLLFDGLVALQERTGVPITIPDSLGEGELATLRKVATVALTGELIDTWDRFDLTIATSAISPQILAALLEGSATPLVFPGQSEVRLGDAAIPLGEQHVTLASARLVNIDEVREAINADAPTATLQLVPGDDAAVLRRFRDWQPQSEELGSSTSSEADSGGNAYDEG